MGRKRTLARSGNERPLTDTGLYPGNDRDGRKADVPKLIGSDSLVIIAANRLYLATVATAGYSRFDSDAKFAGFGCLLQAHLLAENPLFSPNGYGGIWPNSDRLLWAAEPR